MIPPVSSWSAVLLIAFAISLLASQPVIAWGRRRGIVRTDDKLSLSAQRQIPRVGGSILLAGLAAGWFSALSLGVLSELPPAVWIGAIVIYVLGVTDDLWGLGAPSKLLVEIPVAVMLFASGLGLDMSYLPGDAFQAAPMLNLVVTVLWVVGIMNAVNLIDGSDGLAGGIALVAALVFGVGAALAGSSAALVLCALLGGAILAFLLFNYPPAKVFLGDSGSLLLGYALAVIGLLVARSGASLSWQLFPAFVLGLPILDSVLALVRRAAARQPLFKGDEAHLHHRLRDNGVTAHGIVGRLSGVSVLLGGFALVQTSESLGSRWPVYLAIAALFFASLLSFIYSIVVAAPTAGSVEPADAIESANGLAADTIS